MSDTVVGSIDNSIFVGLEGSDAADNSDVVIPNGLAFLRLSKEIVGFLGADHV